jgi:hypothetical protein
MPYKSDAQRRWAHTDSAKKAGFPTEEFDKASKGKELPEKKMAAGGNVGFPRREKSGPSLTKAPTKFAEGGVVSPYPTNPQMEEESRTPNESELGDQEFAQPDKIKEVMDFLEAQFANPTPEFGSTLEGFHSLMEQHQENNPSDNYDLGGLVTKHKNDVDSAEAEIESLEKGPQNPPQVQPSSGTASGYADGGTVYPSGNEDLPEAPDLLTEASTDPSDAFASLLRGGNPYKKPNLSSVPTEIGPGLAGTGADYLNGQALSAITKNPTPVFNPKIGLPPTPPPQPQLTTPAAPPTPQGFNLVQNPAIGQAQNYIQGQKNAYNQYGPEQQMALQQSLAQKYGGLQGKGASALGGLADAIEMGVARTGNPGFQRNIMESQQNQQKQAIEAMQKAREANIQNVEMGQKLDAQDPKSPLSKLTQSSYAPLMAKLGYKNLSGMSAAQIETVAKVAAEFGGKEMERLWQNAKLIMDRDLKNREMKLGAAKDIATEGVGTKLANAIPGTAGHAAQQQLEETAGIEAGPQPLYAQGKDGHMITSADGGKTWTPIAQ